MLYVSSFSWLTPDLARGNFGTEVRVGYLHEKGVRKPVKGGTVSGNVWTWTMESNVDGKLTKSRMTVTERSPISYTVKIEFSTDGGAFVLLEEMKASKVQ